MAATQSERERLDHYGRDELVRVYRDTKSYCERYKVGPKPRVSVHWKEVSPRWRPETGIYGDSTLISVMNIDSIDAAILLRERGCKNPLILNLASDKHPGGGVERGSKAQEEDLFRRTNYHEHLNKERVKYPFPSLTAVYTPNVAIIKDRTYKLLDTIHQFDFIAVAGIRNPYLIDGKLKPFHQDLMIKKVRQIFSIAVENGHDSLVLGAIGCGAFHNPPEEIASIFKSVITELEIEKGVFREIIFAVLCHPDRMENYNVFRSILVGDVTDENGGKSEM